MCLVQNDNNTKTYIYDRILRPNIPPPLPKWIGVGSGRDGCTKISLFCSHTIFERTAESKLLNKNSQLPNSPRSRTELDVGVREEIPEADPDDAPGLVGCRQLVRGGTDGGGGDRFELHRVGVLADVVLWFGRVRFDFAAKNERRPAFASQPRQQQKQRGGAGDDERRGKER